MRNPLDPIALYRFALRCGDLPLVDALTRAFRSHPELVRRADFELSVLPRGALPAAGPPRLIERMRCALQAL